MVAASKEQPCMSRDVPFGALTMEREYPANKSPTVPTARVKYGRHLVGIKTKSSQWGLFINFTVQGVPEVLIWKAVDDVIQAFPIQNINDPDGKAENSRTNNYINCSKSQN